MQEKDIIIKPLQRQIQALEEKMASLEQLEHTSHGILHLQEAISKI